MKRTRRPFWLLGPSMLLLAGPRVARAGCVDWYEAPAAETLHPVRASPGLRWQRATSDVMSGSSASSWYRDTSNLLDVYWRLSEIEDPIPLTPDQTELARELAFAGASMGLQKALQDYMDGSEVLGTARTAADLMMHPGLSVRQGKVALGSASSRRPSQEIAADFSEAPTARRTPASFALGSGFTVVSASGGDAWNLEDPELAARAWLDLRYVGLDAFHVEVADTSVIQADDTLPRWSLSAREGLVPGWFIMLGVDSDPVTALPARTKAGLQWNLPWLDDVYTRSTISRRAPRPGEDPAEWRVDLSVRASLAWHVPQDIDRWPLGKVPGISGIPLPYVPPTGPNQVVQVVRSPAERESPGWTTLPPLRRPATQTAEGEQPASGLEVTQGEAGVPGDIGVGRRAQPAQHRDGACVADAPQSPDGVEGRVGLVRLDQGEQRR